MDAKDEQNQTSALPISLKKTASGWSILCAGRPPLTLPESSSPDLLSTVKRALDQRAQLHFRLDRIDNTKIVAIDDQLPQELPEAVVKSAPKLPESVTEKVIRAAIPKDATAYTQDKVLWVTEIPSAGVIRFTFEKQAAPYYLATVHPYKAQALATAQNSIQTGQSIRVAIQGQYILDLKP